PVCRSAVALLRSLRDQVGRRNTRQGVLPGSRRIALSVDRAPRSESLVGGSRAVVGSSLGSGRPGCCARVDEAERGEPDRDRERGGGEDRQWYADSWGEPPPLQR